MPWRELLAVVRVFWKGYRKYRDWGGWKRSNKNYWGALGRHTNAYGSGRTWCVPTDDESGEQHLAHVAANALILMWRERNK
jgi:hypothetical protein